MATNQNRQVQTEICPVCNTCHDLPLCPPPATSEEISEAVALLKEAQRVLNLEHVLSSDPRATDGKTHACDSWKVGAVESYVRTALKQLERLS